MLVIRLSRKGRKNQPFFNIVVVDKRRSAKGGRAVEILGHLDPLTKKKSLKKERVLHWLKIGAKASPTVHNLLVSEKIIEAKKISKHKKKPVAPPSADTAGGPKKEVIEEKAVTAETVKETAAAPEGQEEKKAETSAETPEATKEEIPPEAPK